MSFVGEDRVKPVKDECWGCNDRQRKDNFEKNMDSGGVLSGEIRKEGLEEEETKWDGEDTALPTSKGGKKELGKRFLKARAVQT